MSQREAKLSKKVNWRFLINRSPSTTTGSNCQSDGSVAFKPPSKCMQFQIVSYISCYPFFLQCIYQQVTGTSSQTIYKWPFSFTQRSRHVLLHRDPRAAEQHPYNWWYLKNAVMLMLHNQLLGPITDVKVQQTMKLPFPLEITKMACNMQIPCFQIGTSIQKIASSVPLAVETTSARFALPRSLATCDVVQLSTAYTLAAPFRKNTSAAWPFQYALCELTGITKRRHPTPLVSWSAWTKFIVLTHTMLYCCCCFMACISMLGEMESIESTWAKWWRRRTC